MSPRTSLGIFVATALATRLLGIGTSQEAEVREPRRPARAVVSEAPQFTYSDRLRERLKEPVTPQRGRNPFLYGARNAPATARRDALLPDAAPIMPAEPPAPAIKLSGIAANQTDGVVELTAILNDHGALVFAQTGDRLASGYTVVRVDETAITLVDASGVTMTLRLP